MFSTEIKFNPARWQSTFRVGGAKRQHVDEGEEAGGGETTVLDVEGKEHQVYDAGGGWTGAKWIKDWRG